MTMILGADPLLNVRRELNELKADNTSLQRENRRLTELAKRTREAYEYIASFADEAKLMSDDHYERLKAILEGKK